MRFEKFRTAPRFIREGLVFPYDQGTQFVSAFRQKGWSWQEMSLLYERPPLSTEQIMHVGAYLNEDSPEAIQFSLINDWPQSQRTSSNVWGELGYRQYFRHHLSSKEAYKAASGWQGDRYEVLKQADHYAFALISHWESPTEAEEFLNAYRQSLALRYKTQTRDYAGGTLVAADKKFSTWIGRKASEVVVLEHIPQEQLEPLIETFLKRRWN